MRRIGVAAAALALLATAVPASAAGPAVRVIGEQRIPNGLTYHATTVGGLSGIDYDPRTGGYVLISDDRSQQQPARFYTARFPVTAAGIGPVTLTGTHPLLRPSGTPYPPLSANDPALPQNEQTVDPEEIRVDPYTGDYLWSQEGERSGATLIDPSVRAMSRDGHYRYDLSIPANERMLPTSGPRTNLVLEGISYAGLGTLVASSVEAPLLQDGDASTPEHGSLSRMTVQVRFGPILGQFAYPQEPVFASGAGGSTGVSSLLAADPVDPTRYLFMERGFVSGVGNRVRIFVASLRGATNVLHTPSLAGAHVTPMRKHLLVDLADLPLSTVDNIEGMTWGPPLPGGHRSLILVSDNNFSDSQVTQLIALDVPPAALR